MSYTMNPLPQVALQRLIQEGIAILKSKPEILDAIFNFYMCEPMEQDYGQGYLDNLKEWFVQTKIPVVQSWSLNPQKAPQISIKLATEAEDEGKAAIGDHWGEDDESTIGSAPFVTHLDVGIHASKNSDETMWLYEIVKFILFKRKRRAEQLGLQLHTFSATDLSRDTGKLADNIFVRHLRVRTITQTFWDAEDFLDIDDIEVDLSAESTDGTGILVDV